MDDNGIANPLDRLVGYRLRRASSEAMVDLGRELGTLGLRPAEASALVLIAANPGVTQSEIGRVLNIQRANMAPLTARLEKLGLIERTRVDGRSQGLSVSAAGTDLAGRAHAAMKAHDKGLIAHIPQAARGGFESALQALFHGAH